MIMSLSKPPATAGPLSRRGDYLVAARGPGLFLGIRRRTTTFPYESTVTRGPPHPLFHRRRGEATRHGVAHLDGASAPLSAGVDESGGEPGSAGLCQPPARPCAGCIPIRGGRTDLLYPMRSGDGA